MAIEKPPRDDILSLFARDDPGRAEEKYLLFRSKLIWYFDRHNCECPEGLADETVFRIVKAVCSGKNIDAPNPFAYFWAVAGNVRKEEWKRPKSEPLKSDAVSHESSSNPENHMYLDECLKRSLPPEEENLLRRYYADGCEATARRLGVTVPWLKVKLHRIKNKVRKFAADAAGKQDSAR